MCSSKNGRSGASPGVLTAAEMRALEADAFASGRLDSRAVMGVAGAQVVAALEAAEPARMAVPGRAAVLCGPGNNGGDGYVIAALLAARGWRVEVFAMGDPAALSADARHYREAWAAEHRVGALTEAAPALAAADLVIDALFGIGLARPLEGAAAAVVQAVPEGPLRVAVDVPSGRDTDTGAALGGIAFPADLVVTFHAEKPVHAVLRGEGVAVAVRDIGL